MPRVARLSPCVVVSTMFVVLAVRARVAEINVVDNASSCQ